MPKPRTIEQCGIGPFWRVRVVLPGALIHLASRTEPIVRPSAGRIADVEMDLITGTEHGDTIGYIDWPAAIAVTWRAAPCAPAPAPEPEEVAPAKPRVARARKRRHGA